MEINLQLSFFHEGCAGGEVGGGGCVGDECGCGQGEGWNWLHVTNLAGLGFHMAIFYIYMLFCLLLSSL